MKISAIESFATKAVAFVRVRTDGGDHGWGQVSTYNADITARVLHRQVAPHALGADADAPGWGVEISEAWLAGATFQTSKIDA